MASIRFGDLLVSAVRLDDPLDDRASELHPVELRRAATFASGWDRDRFLGGRLAIRSFAANILSAAPRELVLDYSCRNCRSSGSIDHGRPGYSARRGGEPVRISLSRSGPWCAMVGAVGPGTTAVGIDVENSARVRFAGFDDVVLTAAERSSLAGIADPEATRVRARLWTRKEAFLKVLGTGLLREPSTVEASARNIEGIEVMDIDPRELGMPSGYTAAVAFSAGSLIESRRLG
ncbi:4'-phosphopantetheinyl transferase family protein [Planctomonas psychrotolerans]|uniref:4'-phosphopantetheinyl transferase family protein n=1 Tax=Planctomonas psychrotolerans TaxID=2528712 RepID=UPI001239D6AF|nr:4'-phosphopantetheinyl transferase superfamily protein [Planctomonas psychrotolerans]